VDSTLYTTSSMLRTIELLLGLPPMTKYDASAMPFALNEIIWKSVRPPPRIRT
jgi:hypothetical protein